MLTSMFRKTLAVYMTVMVIAFSVLAFALHVEMKHFLADQRLKVLNQEAKAILPILESVNGNPRLYPAYSSVVSRYRKTDDVTVNLLLVRNSRLSNIEKLTNQFISHNNILSASAVKSVLAGQEIQLIGSFSKTIRDSTLIVGLPIKNNGIVIGALFLHTPVQDLKMGQITQIIIIISIPVLLLSMVILYFTSRRFSRPLLQMNRAVQSIGEGNFGERLTVNSQDEIGQLSNTFNHMTMQLERLENMRKDLIANVSHEIRTPLTSVRGFIQGILEGVIPPADQKQYLEVSYKELHRLSGILNTMLDLSAIETGRIAMTSAPVTWTSVVDVVMERVKVRTDEKGINLKNVMHDESLTVWGDAERLTQVLFNIVDNAIRHTSEGEISIITDVVNGQLRAQIRDTGDGIAKENLSKIWERFYTGSISRTSNDERIGLGLTITRYLVELMNGHIEVQSTVSSGTTFTLRFPIFSSSLYS